MITGFLVLSLMALIDRWYVILCATNKLYTVTWTRLSKNTIKVSFYRISTYMQLVGNLFILSASSNEASNHLFAFGKRRENNIIMLIDGLYLFIFSV